jgi:CRISPR-associated protein Cas2
VCKFLAALQAAGMRCQFSLGIGLRPQKPWAGISRPVGPVERFPILLTAPTGRQRGLQRFNLLSPFQGFQGSGWNPNLGLTRPGFMLSALRDFKIAETVTFRGLFRRQADRLAAALTRDEPYESFLLPCWSSSPTIFPDDRRRTRLAHTLKDFGQRVQYSVFECLLAEDQMAHLRARVAKLTDPTEDSVRFYRLCANCEARIEIQGLGKVRRVSRSRAWVRLRKIRRSFCYDSRFSRKTCQEKSMPAPNRQIGTGVTAESVSSREREGYNHEIVTEKQRLRPPKRRR